MKKIILTISSNFFLYTSSVSDVGLLLFVRLYGVLFRYGAMWLKFMNAL